MSLAVSKLIPNLFVWATAFAIAAGLFPKLTANCPVTPAASLNNSLEEKILSLVATTEL